MTITPLKPATLDAIRAGDSDMMRRLLARTWLEQRGDTSLAFAVEGTRVRHSWAGTCARALHYRIADVPESNPPDIASQWVFRLGHLIHDEWQQALAVMFPDCGIEVKHANPVIDGSFTLDAEIQWPHENQMDRGEVHVIEIKSTGGFAFKKQNGARGKEGPRHTALLQLALNATATPGCTGGWLITAATENTSVGEAERHDLTTLDRFLLVHWYPLAQLSRLAELEQLRMNEVKANVDDGTLTPRIIPDPELPPGAKIDDPTTGSWSVKDRTGATVDVGKTWNCLYCSFQAKCLEDGPS